MRGITRIPTLKGVPVLVRAALNVPVENGVVANTFRLRQALPTIEYLQKKGAKVILVGHITGNGTESLAPMYEAMKKFIPLLEFSPITVGKEARDAVRNMKPGDVLMLENLRRYKGEEANDPHFAASLAELADVFVQDCFDVCHRSHASVVGVAGLLPSYAGFLVEEEVKQLKRALKPKRPALAIIGGAKFSTKEPVLVALLDDYEHVFVGGALANDFIQAKGCSVGASLVSDAPREEIARILANPELIIPQDVVVASPDARASEGRAVLISEVASDEAMLDVGPASIEALLPLIKKAKTILWNGPLGRYENGFTAGTFALAKAITESRAHTILGGGDTVAALDALGLTSKFSFVSTGGGAMLDFLADGKLPGLEVLR